jgi:hypothetical protein
LGDAEGDGRLQAALSVISRKDFHAEQHQIHHNGRMVEAMAYAEFSTAAIFPVSKMELTDSESWIPGLDRL